MRHIIPSSALRRCTFALASKASLSSPRLIISQPHSTPLSLRSIRYASSIPNPAVLEHHHLRGDGPGGIVSYDVAETLQEQHRSRFLEWKALSEDSRAKSGVDCPSPTLISFESSPTFTLGRRQTGLTADQTARLEQPLAVDLSRHLVPVKETFRPCVRETNRGGLTTYHGPGQLVLWPVLDMHSPLYARYGVASYAAHLEATTRQLLADVFGIKTYSIRDEPGVWVDSSPSSSSSTGGSGPPRKIAAMGVHHRRYVTALGIAINVDLPVTGPEETNPWARFVPCGLEGKLVTSVAAEVGPGYTGVGGLGDLARRWAAIFEQGMRDEMKRKGGR